MPVLEPEVAKNICVQCTTKMHACTMYWRTNRIIKLVKWNKIRVNNNMYGSNKAATDILTKDYSPPLPSPTFLILFVTLTALYSYMYVRTCSILYMYVVFALYILYPRPPNLLTKLHLHCIGTLALLFSTAIHSNSITRDIQLPQGRIDQHLRSSTLTSMTGVNAYMHSHPLTHFSRLFI